MYNEFFCYFLQKKSLLDLVEKRDKKTILYKEKAPGLVTVSGSASDPFWGELEEKGKCCVTPDPLETFFPALLLEKNKPLVTAESCTGGLLGEVLTAFSGISRVYQGGWVTYSNSMKENQLGVSPGILTQYGAVSMETATAMASGALKHCRQAQMALAVTGIAGPGGGSPEKPAGTVCIATGDREQGIETILWHFEGDRHSVRRQSLWAAFWQAADFLTLNIEKNKIQSCNFVREFMFSPFQD